MAKTVFFYFTILILIVAVDGAQLQLSNYTRGSKSECKSGFVAGIDRIVYTGTAVLPEPVHAKGTNVSGQVLDDIGESAIAFKLKVHRWDHTDVVCLIGLWKNECYGEFTDTVECTCSNYTSPVVKVYLNLTADIKYSNNEISLAWTDSSDRKRRYYSNFVKFPVIESDFKETLTLDETTIDLSSCDLLVQHSSTLRWCVSGLRPHTLKISSGKQSLAEGKDCVSYTIEKTSSLSSVTVSFIELSHCKRSRSHNCGLKILHGARLQMSNYSRGSKSECKSGFVSGKDRIMYTGTVVLPDKAQAKQRHVSDHDLDENVESAIAFKLKVKRWGHTDVVCLIGLWKNECYGEFTDPVECTCSNYTSPVVKVHLNLTADIKYSNNEIRLSWTDSPDSERRVYSNFVKFPVIESDFKETLTLDEKTIDLNSCNFLVQHSTTLRWCVSGLTSHTLKISSGEQTLVEGKDCVNYTIEKTSSLSSVTVSFIEHSHCQRDRSHVCGLKFLHGARLQMSNYSRGSNSECKSGFVSGKDRIMYTGTVVLPDKAQAKQTHASDQDLDENRESAIAFKLKVYRWGNTDVVCLIGLWKNECYGEFTDEVECKCSNYTSPVVKVYLNLTADIKYSNNEIWLAWTDSPDRERRVYSNFVKFPVIESDFKETLTLDEKTIDLSSCDLLLKPSTTLKWCVSGLKSHTLKISSGQQTLVEGRDECVSYTIAKTSSLSSVFVSFIEHSHCERTRSYVCGLKKMAQSRASTSDASAVVVSREALCLRNWIMCLVISHFLN